MPDYLFAVGCGGLGMRLIRYMVKGGATAKPPRPHGHFYSITLSCTRGGMTGYEGRDRTRDWNAINE